MITKQLKGIYMRKENNSGCVRILDEEGVAVEYGLVDVVSGSLEGVFDRDIVNCVMRLSEQELALLASYRGKGCPFLERPLRLPCYPCAFPRAGLRLRQLQRFRRKRLCPARQLRDAPCAREYEGYRPLPRR